MDQESRREKELLMKRAEAHRLSAGKCFYCTSCRSKGNDKPVMYYTEGLTQENCSK